ncbi:TetR/AcrR family transcriptional regulator [Paramicrobacterium fandaimingii]|uniref:TetR/AcrR family transcriptional regulator n=1 Tax=Paramicrobacterium fandaimingii TaxID=2708079 RepID=UPI00141EC3C6|nr:TetR/AcrR family transcriptional regulator [Microbacterium fandaimingii]
MVNNRRGRPHGRSPARDQLLEAARRHFEAGDLTRVSARDLAAEVGVSHTLVNYHFGSRDALIAAAVALSAAPHQMVAAATDGRGQIDIERLVHGLIVVWEHPEHGQRLVGFARHLSSGDAGAAALQEYLRHAVFEPLVTAFGQERARYMTTAIVGVVFGRYVLELPILTMLTRRQLAAHLLSMMR